MSLSRQSLVDRAYLRNQSLGGTVAAVPYARYDPLVPQAMTRLAKMVADSPMERLRNQLKKDFTVTVTSGAGSLTTPLTASEPLLDNAIDKATVTSADSDYAWQYLPTYELLTLQRPISGLVYFTVIGSSLKCTDPSSGAVASLSTTATLSANYIPLPATLSGYADLETMSIEVLAQMARESFTQAAA